MTDAERAVAALRDGFTCAFVRGGRLYTSTASGIRPLLDWLAEDPCCFQGAFVADKILGKAAALLLLQGGLDGSSGGVYGGVLSDVAAGVFQQHGIPYACGRRVPHIVNRRGDGVCPMEHRVRDIDDPAAAHTALLAAVAAMRASANDQPGSAREETEREA